MHEGVSLGGALPGGSLVIIHYSTSTDSENPGKIFFPLLVGTVYQKQINKSIDKIDITHLQKYRGYETNG